MSADFVACMEDLLELRAEPYHPKRPTVCFDETNKQLVTETMVGVAAQPGQRERNDYECQRNGSRNLCLFVEPQRGWRRMAVTQRRAMTDFARQMQWLVDQAYPQADLITHRPAALYETFPPAEARYSPSMGVGSTWRNWS